jgi:hypothetical protein
MGFWSKNITGTGRAARILCGIIALAGAVILYLEDIAIWPWIAGAAGVFMIYEGLSGWCIMRACKIRTPM